MLVRYRKLLLWVFGTLTLLAFLPLLILFFQDEITQLFVNQLSQQFERKISAKKATINFYKNFPNVSIALTDVVITANPNWPKDQVAHIQNLYCSFNFNDIINKRYIIKQLLAENGYIHLIFYKDGKTNYQLFENQGKNKSEEKPITLDLSMVKLKNIDFRYDIRKSQEVYEVKAQDVSFRFKYADEMLITLHGKLLSGQIGKQANGFLSNRNFVINGDIAVYQTQQKYSIKTLEIDMDNTEFDLSGEISTHQQTQLDIKLAGKEVSLTTIIALLPNTTASQFTEYNTQGNVYFNGTINGIWTANQMPSITLGFGCKNTSFYHPDMKAQLTNISFDGSFTNGEQHHNTTSVLHIQNFSGNIDESPLTGELTIQNFDNPLLDFKLKTDLNAEQLINFYPITAIETLTGTIQADITFKGNIPNLLNKTSVPDFTSASRVDLRNIDIKLSAFEKPMQIPYAAILLEANALKLDSTVMTIGESDMSVTAIWKNFLASLFTENTLPEIDARINALDWNLDDWKTTPKSQADTSSAQNVSFGLQNSSLRLDIGKFSASKYTLTNVFGRLEAISPTYYNISPIRFDVSDGSMEANATVKVVDKHYNIDGDYNLLNINIKKLFALFDNFGQQNLTADNLEGILNGKLDADIWLLPDGNANFKKTRILADLAISEGKLINYKPLYTLGKFLKNRDYDRVSFTKLENTFTIEQEKLYIPRMFINSSIGRIYLTGTQHFSGKLDYRLQIPLNTFKRNQEEIMQTAVSQNTDGAASLFLKIEGTTDDMKITYDINAVKDKWISFFEKQKDSILGLFRSKNKK